MTITITATDFDKLCQQGWASGEAAYYCNNFEVTGELPKQFGRGKERSLQLRNGLKILMINGELWQPLSVDTQHDQWSFLISKFYLSGSSRVLTPGVKEIKNDYQEISGHNYLYYLPNLTEFEVWSAGEQIHVVMVYVELDFLRSFSQGLDSLQKTAATTTTRRKDTAFPSTPRSYYPCYATGIATNTQLSLSGDDQTDVS